MPIILFIDEAHTMIGAGGQAGQSDAANLLKPALARGELRTIAATTWAEYKKYFEKDAALARRFQVVKVEEPDEDRAIRMMRGITATLEKHHGVRILDEAVESAVKLSHRYIPGPAAAGQVRQPAGHRLCPGGDQPECDPAGRRGLPPPDRPPSDSSWASSTARAPPGSQHAERMAEVQQALERAPRPAGRAGGAVGGRAKAGRGDPRPGQSDRSSATSRRSRKRRRNGA